MKTFFAYPTSMLLAPCLPPAVSKEGATVSWFLAGLGYHGLPQSNGQWFDERAPMTRGDGARDVMVHFYDLNQAPHTLFLVPWHEAPFADAEGLLEFASTLVKAPGAQLGGRRSPQDAVLPAGVDAQECLQQAHPASLPVWSSQMTVGLGWRYLQQRGAIERPRNPQIIEPVMILGPDPASRGLARLGTAHGSMLGEGAFEEFWFSHGSAAISSAPPPFLMLQRIDPTRQSAELTDARDRAEWAENLECRRLVT